MQHYWSLEAVSLDNVWLAIGAFDGVHCGHQEILRQLTADAHQAGATVVVLTFHPHPVVVLRGYQEPLYLTTPERRAELLGEYGADVVITLPFTREVAALTTHQFLNQLQAHLKIHQLWVGYDFAMGRNREGNGAVLRQLEHTFGYTFREIPAVLVDGEIVSSSQIRSLLTAGEVGQAARKLGHLFQVEGKVIPGDGRGRTIGILTANLQTAPQIFLPRRGVYACWAELEGKRWPAATNVGIRPTFDNVPSSAASTLETHLLDFQGDLYGQKITLEFITRLRGEQRFANASVLVNQIRQDIINVREALALEGQLQD